MKKATYVYIIIASLTLFPSPMKQKIILTKKKKKIQIIKKLIYQSKKKKDTSIMV